MEHEIDKASKNEQGNSLYPKLVYPNGPGTKPVKVLNYKHEQEVMGVKEEKKKEVKEEKKEEAKELKPTASPWS